MQKIAFLWLDIFFCKVVHTLYLLNKRRLFYVSPFFILFRKAIDLPKLFMRFAGFLCNSFCMVVVKEWRHIFSYVT